MKEVIEQLTKLIEQHKNVNGSSASQPNEDDTKEMLSILKDLMDLKGKELSAYNRLLCHAAHSLRKEEIDLFKSLCSECTKNINSLEDLWSSMKSIM